MAREGLKRSTEKIQVTTYNTIVLCVLRISRNAWENVVMSWHVYLWYISCVSLSLCSPFALYLVHVLSFHVSFLGPVHDCLVVRNFTTLNFRKIPLQSLLLLKVCNSERIISNTSSCYKTEVLGDVTEVLLSGVSDCYSTGQMKILALWRGRMVISGMEGEHRSRQQHGWLICLGANREICDAAWHAGV